MTLLFIHFFKILNSKWVWKNWITVKILKQKLVRYQLHYETPLDVI